MADCKRGARTETADKKRVRSSAGFWERGEGHTPLSPSHTTIENATVPLDKREDSVKDKLLPGGRETAVFDAREG